MSYQVIARKWRPQRFDDVSGQGHVTTALRNAIRADRIPHALLLTGPRGVGKTTLARLIARCLNCEKGPTDEPCGACTACVEITEGRSIDVQEIDAASRTGVDDMREVIESIRYAAAPGKHRIYIIDEVHMLSTAAFNALLKTLEEPPPRSLFVFATTNPEKIPFTVLSRCQRHDLRRIALSSITERLGEICASENIEITPGALAAIAREGDGSMRDAQTLLDQIVAYASDASNTTDGTRISDEVVADVLDLVDRRLVRGIIEAALAGDTPQALELLGRALGGGSEVRRVADALLEALRDLTVLRIAPESEELYEGTDEDRGELAELAGRAEPARLRRMFRALLRDLEDLSWAPQPSAVLEMAVIRIATMPRGDDVATLLARLDRLERQLAGGAGAGRSGSSGPAPSGTGGTSAAGGPKRGAGRAKARAKGTKSAATSPTLAAPAAEPDSAPPSPASSNGGPPPEALFDRLRSKALDEDRARFASLEGAEAVALEGDTLRLGVRGRFHADRLRPRLEELQVLAERLFGRPLSIEVEAVDRNGPAEQDQRARETSRKRKQEALNSEPVNLAIDVLGAEIVEIRPLGESS